MALLQHERQELKARIQRAIRYGHQIALLEWYHQELAAMAGGKYPVTPEGVLEMLQYLENPRAVKVEPVVEPVLVIESESEPEPEPESIVSEPSSGLDELVSEAPEVETPAASRQPEKKSKKK